MSRSHVQQRLAFPDPAGLVCAAGREEPTLWVRRIVIWHDIASAPIRDILLRRGLNIVWSPPGDDPDALATGHAAGKTLLCRLLRYCLGEDSFADPEDTQAIRMRFPEGAVGAEVRLRGQTWVVRRRFGIPRDDRAVKTEDLLALADDAFRDSFGSFMGALESMIFDEGTSSLLTELLSTKDAWQYVLAWLTRDQECRIDELTHWRHPESSSHSPAGGPRAGTRLNVLRIVVGLHSKASSAVRKEIDESTKAVEKLKATARQAEARFNLRRDELAHALGVGSERVWPPSIDLLQADPPQTEMRAREAHLQALTELADQRIRSVHSVSTDPSHARYEAELSGAEGDLARVNQELARFIEEIDRKRHHVNLLEQEYADRWARVREAKHPACPYDDTPLDVEKARFVCPLPRLPDPATAVRIAEEIAAARQKALDEIADDERKLALLYGEKASHRTRAEALRRTIEVHQLAISAATNASQAAWATKGMVRRLFELRTEADVALAAEEEAKGALRQHQDLQLAGLSEFSNGKLQGWFDYLVRRIVAPEAIGRIVLDGNGLHPKIEWRGTRRSVALNSLQIVLFDLAAMLCAVEGGCPSPAFLVHDSPREGDLDHHTYARIFRAISELGRDEDMAPFQYVLTTTTEPPESVRDRVRLQIAADIDEQRLLRVDL